MICNDDFIYLFINWLMAGNYVPVHVSSMPYTDLSRSLYPCPQSTDVFKAVGTNATHWLTQVSESISEAVQVSRLQFRQSGTFHALYTQLVLTLPVYKQMFFLD